PPADAAAVHAGHAAGAVEHESARYGAHAGDDPGPEPHDPRPGRRRGARLPGLQSAVGAALPGGGEPGSANRADGPADGADAMAHGEPHAEPAARASGDDA